jgi:hypothetical protein
MGTVEVELDPLNATNAGAVDENDDPEPGV